MEELILRKDIPFLGKIGDVVSVAPGYARNYLVPRKLAMRVSPENLKLIEKEQVRAREAAEVVLQGQREVAAKLEAASVTVAAKSNEDGTLFGSITAENVTEALAADGFQVSPEMLGLAEEGRAFPLKEVGVYVLTVQLSDEVQASTKLWVVQE